MNGRPANPKYARNKNVLVIGGSGSGKTRFYVKPNLMQMHSSYCVTDPKGTIVLECGKMLEDNGYEIKILNTINFKKYMKYNPFAYIRSEKDILKLVRTIIANTKGEGEKAGEDFWVKAEKLYYTALIGYIFYEAPREEKNFATLLDMIDASEVREDDETYMNPIDRLFEALEKKEPTHFAVKQYKKYKLAAGRIYSSRKLDYSNLVYSCFTCNRKKLGKWPTENKDKPNDGKVGFVDPALKEYDTHLGRDKEGSIEFYTSVGKYMYKNAFRFDIRPMKEIWEISQLINAKENLFEIKDKLRSEELMKYFELDKAIDELKKILFEKKSNQT